MGSLNKGFLFDPRKRHFPTTIAVRQFYENRNGIEHLMTSMALIAIGANLPRPDGATPLQTCRHAAVMLDRLPGARLAGLSRWYVSAPVPPSGQPPYVNGVALLVLQEPTSRDPAVFLRQLFEIEADCGRQRSVPNAARTLDLDLIAFETPEGPVVRAAPDLILPHPRAHLRAFVLAPIADVAPTWQHPVLGRTAADLLSDLPDQEIGLLSE
ncbi:MAG TPA: 2-amino-4-hydroxy-6-hydroxymethyldihydropteridine diphosphokinase [Rhodopila sp.]|nr:2-amino-4-hydroxy-6-hydroxymethyldihydropteridine diphosphokinase [Rhodopila sp.]